MGQCEINYTNQENLLYLKLYSLWAMLDWHALSLTNKCSKSIANAGWCESSGTIGVQSCTTLHSELEKLSLINGNYGLIHYYTDKDAIHS